MTAGLEVTQANESIGFRVRLRFRLHKRLHADVAEQVLSVAGFKVSLKSATNDEKLSDANWLVMNARGFISEEDARAFGLKLKKSVELAAVRARMGVYCGMDAATSGLGREFRAHLLLTTGKLFRDNIHGLDVFQDDPKIAFSTTSIEGSVLIQPDLFYEGVQTFHPVMGQVEREVNDILLLLNFALMNPEPVAQIVFAVSAVEMLGQKNSSWSEEQKALIRQLAERARADASLPPDAAEQVADAIERAHRVSLRQGVIGLLKNLGLPHLRAQWDKLYSERSTLVHGLAPRPGLRYDDLAHRTVSLCGHILLKAIAREVQGADSVGNLYPVA